MRTHGTLIKWNDDRGFGFIPPAQGSSEIFVHISAFPRDSVRPSLKELVSYEVEKTHDGKLRAVRVMRPGGRPRARTSHRQEASGRSSNAIGLILGALAIVVLGAFVYPQFFVRPGIESSRGILHVTPTIPEPATANSSFSCDGRTLCSQMTSCAEAEYFLEHCPNTRMDGNHDGEPCEQQWCN